MLYVIVLPYAASSPFLHSFSYFVSPQSLLFSSFLHLSSLFLNFGTLHPLDLPLCLSLSLGQFQGFPRLSYKGKTRLERVDIHSTRVRPTFTMQTWISMVSPNKYHEVSRCWPRRIASLPSLAEGETVVRDSRLWSRFMKSGEMLTFYRVAWVVPLKR